jgi:Zn finger protein HypA/HybF involved in hydrogenase expression
MTVQFYWEIIARDTTLKMPFSTSACPLSCSACPVLRVSSSDRELICQCGGVGAKIIGGEKFFVEAGDVED